VNPEWGPQQLRFNFDERAAAKGDAAASHAGEPTEDPP
jgi:hypothetical protein